MSYNWNKFAYIFNEEGPTDAEIAAANKDIHTMGRDEKKPHPKSPAGKLRAAGEKRLSVKKKYFGGKTDPSKVDTAAAIAQHRADIYAAGKRGQKKLSQERKAAGVEDWTEYQRIGALMAEALGYHVDEAAFLAPLAAGAARVAGLVIRGAGMAAKGIAKGVGTAAKAGAKTAGNVAKAGAKTAGNAAKAGKKAAGNAAKAGPTDITIRMKKDDARAKKNPKDYENPENYENPEDYENSEDYGNLEGYKNPKQQNDWTTYQTIGHIIAEVLGPKARYEAIRAKTGDGEKAWRAGKKRAKRLEAVARGRGVRLKDLAKHFGRRGSASKHLAQANRFKGGRWNTFMKPGYDTGRSKNKPKDTEEPEQQNDWAIYQTLGRLISEVLTPSQHAQAVGDPMAHNRRSGRIKSVMKGKGIGPISAKRALGKKGVSLSQGAEKQKKYRDSMRAKGEGLPNNLTPGDKKALGQRDVDLRSGDN
jgi:hypothetical protein